MAAFQLYSVSAKLWLHAAITGSQIFVARRYLKGSVLGVIVRQNIAHWGAC
jgi:hypothetical protein